MEFPYAFSICPMRPKTGIAERQSPHGRWRPPKALGNNLKEPPATHFYFSGQGTTILESLPEYFIQHRVYSIYYERAIFWTVDYDATLNKVSNGSEGDPEDNPEEETSDQNQLRHGLGRQSAANPQSSDSSSNDDEEDEDDDWAPMKFDHRESDRLSYAGRHQPFFRLKTRRVDQNDQDWAIKLLPDTCSAEEETGNLKHGGLIGELPLLIALMALATPAEQLAAGLCQSIGRTWTAPNFDRTAGWKDKRGMVITTYACPPDSKISDLIDYERGKHGNILQ